MTTLVKGGEIKLDTEFKVDSYHRSQVLKVCEAYGWTIEYVENLSTDWLDFILRLKKEEQVQREKEANKKKK